MRTAGRLLSPGAVLLLAIAMIMPAAAHAAGPGLPTATYPTFQPLSIMKSGLRGTGGTSDGYGNPPITSPRGEGTAQMYDGYLFVPFGRDSGYNGGGFGFWDVSDATRPRLVKQVNEVTLREAHGFGFTGRHVVMQSINGIQFWDFTDPLNPVMLKDMALPGVEYPSDYARGVWWTFWQAPYVYVGGSGNGLYVVNAADPRNPVLVRTVPTSTWGGFRVGPTIAVGNLLVMTSMDQAGLVTMDISDPANPRLLAASNGSGGQYSGIVNGERLITAGTDSRLRVYDISDPTVIRHVLASTETFAGKGGYLTVQDGYAHAGFSTKYAKIDLATGATVRSATSGIVGRDEDFSVVFGNLVLVSNDHESGSAIVAHQPGPDRTAPVVNMVSPKAGSANQATSSRIGITLTDNIDIRTINSSTFIVRPQGGAALPGRYSAQAGVVNFWPDAPLVAGTTYEVVIPAGGMKDDSGNGVVAFSSTFTTSGAAPVGCTMTTPRSAALVSTSVTFNPATTAGSGLQYSWNFGDGVTTPFSSTSTAWHTYANPGHYPVILTVRASNNATGTCSANQTIHTAPTASAPTGSGTILFDAARSRVWVVNSDTNTITAINSTTNAKALEQAVGANPQTLAQAPDGRIWVTNADSGTISIVNPAGGISQTLTLAPGSRPHGIAFSRNGTAAYVTLQATGTLVKLNPSTGATQGSVAVGPTPRGIAITGDSARIFVTHFISPASQGQVTEVSASSFTVTRTIPLAVDAGPDTESSGRGVPNYVASIALQPDGTRAWIPSKKDNTGRGLFRDSRPLTFESTVRTIVSQIALGTDTEVLSARIDLNDREMANAVVFSPLGDYAFVSTQGTNSVEVVDVYTRQIATGIPEVGRAPRGMVLTPNGRLYVQNFMSRSVSVYDVASLLNSTSNTVVKLADVPTIATETLSAQVLTGKRIFYNAADPRMNRDKYISCASCHQDGGHDGRVFDFTDRGEGLRKTISLIGRSGTGHGRVHWSGNFDEIQDFEHDIRSSFGGTGFMTHTQFNTGTRNTPLGDPKAGVSSDLDALAAYVTSLSTFPRSPFRNPDGSLTPDGVAGQAIFRGTGQCVSCHSGVALTDSASGVLHDVGTLKASSGKRLGAALTGLDTPTLRGIWDAAPYLHDGSAATLMDVLTQAKTSGRHGNVGSLTTTQMDQLVAYLQQIDGTDESPPLVISSLSVKDTANAADWSQRTNLQVGNLQFGDRTFTFTTVPSLVAGAQWIRTANDSRAYTGNPVVTFTLNRAADVYIAQDDRVPLQSWMTGWTNTGQKLVNNEATPIASTLYRKNFPAGTVSLGPSGAGGGMYTLIIK